MLEKSSNMHLDDLNSKINRGQIPIYLIDHAIGACFYPPQDSEHHTLFFLDNFHGPTHDQVNLSEEQKTMMKCIVCLIANTWVKEYTVISRKHAGNIHHTPMTTHNPI